jgi:Aspartyl protease
VVLRRTVLAAMAFMADIGASRVAAQDAANFEISPLLPLHLGDLGALPIVQAHVAGNACRALIDTGATAHIVNARWAAQHSLPVTGRQRLTTVAGSQWVDRVELPSLTIGATPLPTADHALALDLDVAFTPYVEPGGGLDMIVGAPALRDRQATFDIAQRQILWRGSRSPLVDPVTLEVQVRSGLPVIALEVGGRSAAVFLFDTGNAGAMVVFARQAERWLSDGPALPQTVAHEVGGPVRALHALADRVGAGDWHVVDVPVAFEAGTGARRGGHFDAFAGSVGLALFAGRAVTLDIRAGRLALGQVKGSDRLQGGFGMRLIGTGMQAAVVQAVFDDGPAARAGIRPGAALRKVDEHNVSDWSATRLWAWLAERVEATFEFQSLAHSPLRVTLQRAAFFPRWR